MCHGKKRQGNRMRILIAEDERDLNHLIAKRLRDAGYSVDACYDGEQVFDYLSCAEYDAVILDIMMPKRNGIEVLGKMRAGGSTVPVLLLTAKDSIEDRVTGLDAGADDYLIKPFAFEELLARLRVLLRKPVTEKSNVLTVGDLSLHVDTRRVFRKDREIQLSSKEYALLHYMMQNAGIVLSRDKLEQHVWDYDFSGGSNVIDVYIRYLRKKVDEGYEQKLIHTVRGHGYVIRQEKP